MSKRPGYKPVRTLYRLNFSQTEHAGLEVVAKGTSLKGLMELMDIGSELDGLKDLDVESLNLKEVREKLEGLFRPFAKVLHDWNVLDDDDELVPATLDGLLSQEIAFIGQIIEAYISAVAEAPPPLRSSSPAAGTSPEAAAALASQSASLPSSPEPG